MAAGDRIQVGVQLAGRQVTHVFRLVCSLPRWWTSAGIGGGGPAAAGPGTSWEGIGLGKGRGEQNPGRDVVLLAGGSSPVLASLSLKVEF